MIEIGNFKPDQEFRYLTIMCRIFLSASHLRNQGSKHGCKRDDDNQKNGQFDGTEKIDNGLFH